MAQNYKPLIAGDVRKPDDEVRKTGKPLEFHVKSYTGQSLDEYRFSKVYLVGHAILQSDLMIAEFRRPC